jgi:hypothetical protein
MEGRNMQHGTYGVGKQCQQFVVSMQHVMVAMQHVMVAMEMCRTLLCIVWPEAGTYHSGDVS